MQKTAGLQAMLNKGPFGGGSVSDEQLAEGKKKLQKYGKYVEAMEEGERADPTVLISEATAFKQSSNAADARAWRASAKRAERRQRTSAGSSWSSRSCGTQPCGAAGTFETALERHSMGHGCHAIERTSQRLARRLSDISAG